MIETVAIIGGGFSGITSAYHLLAHSKLNVKIIAPSMFGTAYSTRSRSHLLNVRCGNMGAFPSKPDGFWEWIEKQGSSVSKQEFVPRVVYARYLESIVTDISKRYEDRLEIVKEEVVKVERSGGFFTLTTDQGRLIAATATILAIGNLPPQPLSSFNFSDRIIQDPWGSTAFEEISPGDSVLLVGSGLTAVDIALSLEDNGHRGPITILSPRGLLPAAHEEHPKFSSADKPWELGSLNEIIRAVRSHIENAPHWQSVLEWVRPHYQSIWVKLSLPDQERFLRHYARYWNVLRHRMPPQTAARIRRLMESGQLSIKKNWCSELSPHGETVQAILSGNKIEVLEFNWVINCTGPTTGECLELSTLIDQLNSSGLISLGNHGLGLKTTAEGELVGQEGEVIERFYAVGGIRRGELWETTAVPDLRQQTLLTALNVIKGCESASSTAEGENITLH